MKKKINKDDLCPICGLKKAEITCYNCGNVVCPDCTRDDPKYDDIVCTECSDIII